MRGTGGDGGPSWPPCGPRSPSSRKACCGSPWWPVHLAAAAALFLAVASPWFVVGALRQGPPFVRVFLFDENGIARLEHAFLGGGLVPLHSFLLMVPAYVPL